MCERSGVLFQASDAHGDLVGFPPDHGRGLSLPEPELADSVAEVSGY